VATWVCVVAPPRAHNTLPSSDRDARPAGGGQNGLVERDHLPNSGCHGRCSRAILQVQGTLWFHTPPDGWLAWTHDDYFTTQPPCCGGCSNLCDYVPGSNYATGGG
jgi:hypothetical protein